MIDMNKNEGGLRTKGNYKKSYENNPLISIITVVFNGEKYLEETIKSVITQTYANIEYIIIDGCSTDGTLNIIKKYEEKIDYWVSESDKGIYDAMNKGIDSVSGDWINFMNSGDIFFDTFVIENIFEQKNTQKIDVIYGNHEVRYPSRTRIASAGNMRNIWKGSQFSHQSAFIASELHKMNKFNISNRIGADFEFFYALYKNGKEFKFVDIIVSSILSGGVSDIKRVDSIIGRWNIVEKNTKVNFIYIWLVLKETLKHFVKNIYIK